MDSAKQMLRVAKARDKAVAIMQSHTTAKEARAGFLKAADVINSLLGQEDLVRSLRVGAQPGGLDDAQVLELRQFILQELPKQSAFFRQSAAKFERELEKRWWQFRK